MMMKQALIFIIEILIGRKFRPHEKRKLKFFNLVIILFLILSFLANVFLYRKVNEWREGFSDLRRFSTVLKENNKQLIAINTRLFIINTAVLELELNMLGEIRDDALGEIDISLIDIPDGELKELTIKEQKDIEILSRALNALRSYYEANLISSKENNQLAEEGALVEQEMNTVQDEKSDVDTKETR